MGDLAGRTAVVTGGARGIGAAISGRLAEDGADVVVFDIEDASDTIDTVEAAGGAGEYREVDVTDEAALESALADRSIDVLVNNAAYYAPLVEDKKQLEEIDRSEWEAVMEVNVTGTFLATKAALPRFGDAGSVVNLSSSTFHTGVPGFLHYVTSKSAIVGMTRAMATELGDRGIRVNAVTPGLTWSEAARQGGDANLDGHVDAQAIQSPIEPDDIADAVAFLAGPQSDRVTGQLLNVDGGVTYY